MWQGDLLSPFIFILCVEVLVHVINKAEVEGTISGKISGLRFIKKCPSVLNIFCLQTIVYLHVEHPLGDEILCCQRLYEEVSGQEINFQKSLIIFGGDIYWTYIWELLKNEEWIIIWDYQGAFKWLIWKKICHWEIRKYFLSRWWWHYRSMWCHVLSWPSFNVKSLQVLCQIFSGILLKIRKRSIG